MSVDSIPRSFRPLPAGAATSSDEWGTPLAFFARLHEEFRFDMDVCSSSELALSIPFFSQEDDGLAMTWAPRRCYMNPPYSEMKAWIAKAVQEAKRGALVVALVPARTDTGWFARALVTASEIRFVRGRLHFRGAGTDPAPFPSAVIVWGNGAARKTSIMERDATLFALDPEA